MISVKGVTKRFGDYVALDDVSLDVPDGSLTALLGPSGSGKSTLLRIIGGLELPDEGSIEIAGEDATSVPPQRRGIGFVFQHYAAFKHMTVKDNVAFGLSVRKKPKAEIEDRVGELLKIVGLAGYAGPLPEPALRRAATAHGARARARGRAARAPARRALRSARREGARRAARVAPEAARGRARDHAARDPRPGGGDVDRLADRGHGQRPDRADRQPGRALRQAGQPLRHGLPRRDHEGRRRPRAPPRHHDQARAGRRAPTRAWSRASRCSASRCGWS